MHFTHIDVHLRSCACFCEYVCMILRFIAMFDFMVNTLRRRRRRRYTAIDWSGADHDETCVRESSTYYIGLLSVCLDEKPKSDIYWRFSAIMFKFTRKYR